MSDLAKAMQAIADKHGLHALSFAMTTTANGRTFFSAYVHFDAGRCTAGDSNTSPEAALSIAIENANKLRIAAPTIDALSMAEIAA